MSSKDTKNLELNRYQKSDKPPFINYADIEYLVEKIDGCTKINLQNTLTTKVS